MDNLAQEMKWRFGMTGLICLLILLGFLAMKQASLFPSPTAPTITFHAPPLATVVSQSVTLADFIPSSSLTITTSLTLTLPYDLLFTNGQGLMRWEHDEEIRRIIVASPVVSPTMSQSIWQTLDYVAGNDRRQVAIAYGAGTYHKPGTFHLALYDTVEDTVTELFTTTHAIEDLTIAPDNSWLAYIQQDLPPPERALKRSLWRRLWPRNSCGCGESPYQGTIYVVHLRGRPYSPQKVALCGRSRYGKGECKGLLQLFSDETHLAWRDGDGYWRADLDKMTTKLLAQPSNWEIVPWRTIPDRNGRPIPDRTIVRIYRYADQRYGYGLLDSTQWHVLTFPQWMGLAQDVGELFALDAHHFLWSSGAIDGIPGQSTWLYLTLQGKPPHQKLAMQELHLPFSTADNLLAVQLSNRQIGLALLNPPNQGATTSALYIFDPWQIELTKITELPIWVDREIYTGSVNWSPDGVGVIYREYIPQTPQSYNAYIPHVGAPFLDLNSILGQQPGQVVWLIE